MRDKEGECFRYSQRVFTAPKPSVTHIDFIRTAFFNLLLLPGARKMHTHSTCYLDPLLSGSYECSIDPLLFVQYGDPQTSESKIWVELWKSRCEAALDIISR